MFSSIEEVTGLVPQQSTVTQGKPLNKEQEEVLRSKPSVLDLIDKLDKFQQPLATALSKELQINSTSSQNTRHKTETETKNETFLHWPHCRNHCGVRSWLGVVVAAAVAVSPAAVKTAYEATKGGGEGP
ncbi:hypothetical protein JHK82_031895 [Glycine max]|nr:hypothetical protein JHK87_031824 [Glycine soja]KAG4989575.1 hypothetical protein JHK85_032558 [Glycine max]KAG5125158.1 hypothetical protein JHK82_031895 [Glycine max]